MQQQSTNISVSLLFLVYYWVIIHGKHIYIPFLGHYPNSIMVLQCYRWVLMKLHEELNCFKCTGNKIIPHWTWNWVELKLCLNLPHNCFQVSERNITWDVRRKIRGPVQFQIPSIYRGCVPCWHDIMAFLLWFLTSEGSHSVPWHRGSHADGTNQRKNTAVYSPTV